MANPNIQPRPENLTRAGKGQPPKGYDRISLTLPPETIKIIDAIAKRKGWKRNYTINQIVLVVSGFPADWNLSDLEDMRKGQE